MRRWFEYPPVLFCAVERTKSNSRRRSCSVSTITTKCEVRLRSLDPRTTWMIMQWKVRTLFFIHKFVYTMHNCGAKRSLTDRRPPKHLRLERNAGECGRERNGRADGDNRVRAASKSRRTRRDQSMPPYCVRCSRNSWRNQAQWATKQCDCTERWRRFVSLELFLEWVAGSLFGSPYLHFTHFIGRSSCECVCEMKRSLPELRTSH